MEPKLPFKYLKYRAWIPYFVLAIALLFTAATTSYVTRTAKTKDKLRFENAIERTQKDILNRSETYITLLRAGSSLFAADDNVSRSQFRAFVNRLNLQERYPGIQGIGYSVRVQPQDRANLVAAMRQQGIADFNIHPSYPRSEYHAIVYLEPLERRNKIALGYDMFTEATRRAAMERARDTGSPAASGKVTLVQEIDKQKQAGFLFYVPVYRNGDIPNTVAERQASLLGFVYSPFRADDLIQTIIDAEQHIGIAFEIYEGKNLSAENLLHRSTVAVEDSSYQPSFKNVSTIDIAGTTWSIVSSSLPDFELSSERRLVPYIGFAGIAIALILFGITRSLVAARNTAEASAEALRESSTRLRFALDAAQLGDWDLDLATKTARRSLRHERVFGYDTLLPDWSYEIFLNHVYPEDCEYVDREFQRTLRTNEDWNFECRVVWADQSIHWIWATGSVYRNSDGNPIRLIGIVKEITDRKLAEESLRSSEQRFELIAQATNDAIWDWDLLTNSIWWNEGVRTLFGYSPEEISPDPTWWYENIHPEERSRVVSHIHAVINGSESVWSDAYRYRRSDNTYAYVLDRGFVVRDLEGKPIRAIGGMTDISDRKLAEEERDRFFTLSLDLLCIAGMDGYLKRVNPAFEKVLGYTQQELFAKPFIDFIHPEDRSATIVEINRLAVGEPTLYLENRYECKDGAYKWLIWTAVPIVETGLLYAVAHDITHRKAAEMERERLLESEQTARATAEAANRMKDEFLATLSHELRTPLNAMVGWIQLLRTRKFDVTTTNRALETIDRNTKSLQQLIEDILDVSRIITGKLRLNFSTVELRPVIEAAIETVQPAADAKNITIEAKFNFTVRQVFGDASRLQQVFWNLLSNAVKFTPKDGRVEVNLEIVESRVQIRVSDSGQGINPDFLPYVFERFRQEDGTTTRNYGGLGLGLAIVRHIVELHGGTVQAESAGIGKGATFIVNLPIRAVLNPFKKIDEVESIVIKEQQVFCLPSLNGLQVLVVDDEPDARDLISTVLLEYGAEVIAVPSASEAIEKIAQYHFDILVSDIGMPEEDGYALIQKVRALTAEQGGKIPAIALTAYARAEDRTKALLAGFGLHVPKPVNPVELAVAIANLMDRNI